MTAFLLKVCCSVYFTSCVQKGRVVDLPLDGTLSVREIFFNQILMTVKQNEIFEILASHVQKRRCLLWRWCRVIGWRRVKWWKVRSGLLPKTWPGLTGGTCQSPGLWDVGGCIWSVSSIVGRSTVKEEWSQ